MADNSEANPSAQDQSFISRVYEYPLVNTACSQTANYYNQAREQGGIMASVLNLAESGVHALATGTAPLLKHLEQPIGRLDELACQQLDRVENTFPFVRQPTTEVLDESSKFYDDNLRAKVNFILSPVTATVNTLSAAKQYSSESVQKAAEFSSQQLTQLGESAYGQYASEAILRLIKSAEKTMGRQAASGAVNLEGGEAEKAAPSAELTHEERKDLYKSALRDMRALTEFSLNSIVRMTSTISLITYAKTHLNSVNDVADNLLKEYRAKLAELTNKQDADEIDIDDKQQQSLLLTVQNFAEGLRLAIIASSAVTCEHLPTQIQMKLQDFQTNITHAYHRIVATRQLADWSEDVQHEVREWLMAARKALEEATSVRLPKRLNNLLHNHQDDSTDLTNPVADANQENAHVEEFTP